MDDTQHNEMTNACCTAFMIPIGFFVAAVTVVLIAIRTKLLDIDSFTAALYVLGLQVLFLALFSVVYALRSNE